MKYLSNVVSLEYSEENCIGCGKCIEVCPHAVFVLKDKKATITDKDKCMECGACENNCSSGAINVLKGVGCAFAVINSMITGGEPSCDCSNSGDEKSSCC